MFSAGAAAGSAAAAKDLLKLSWLARALLAEASAAADSATASDREATLRERAWRARRLPADCAALRKAMLPANQSVLGSASLAQAHIKVSMILSQWGLTSFTEVSSWLLPKAMQSMQPALLGFFVFRRLARQLRIERMTCAASIAAEQQVCIAGRQRGAVRLVAD